MNTVFLIDGFNFYHSIKSLPPEYHWINYYSYCKHFLTINDSVSKVYLFTAEANWMGDAVVKRHRVLQEASKFYGVEVVLGKFKKKDIYCKLCKKKSEHHEEKYTDVNIALYAYREACKKYVDQIILVTGDTDLVPAIKAVKEDFPNKKVCVIFPYKKFNHEMKNEADFSYKTTKDCLTMHIMPETINRHGKRDIVCPKEWKKIDKTKEN